MSVLELQAHLADLRADFTVKSELERNDENSKATRAVVEEAERADVHLMIAKSVEQGARQLATPEAYGLRVAEGVRTAGDQVYEQEDFKQWAERGANGVSPTVELQYGIRAPIFEWGSGGPPNAATNGVTSLLPVGQPIAPTPRRARLFMRDLIPVQRTGLSTIPYVRELNPVSLEGGASAVQEGNVKPDVSLSFQGAQAPITVVAGNMTVSKQIFEDAQTVMDYINGRLPYLVQVREDAEIIAGSGTWPDISGIRNDAGRQQLNGGTDFATAIANGIAAVELHDGTATACVLNPTDAWAMFTRRASTSGIFDAGVPFSLGMTENLTVWGLPTKRSRIYPVGRCLVADFELGAILFDRESVNVQVYPQHADYPVRNQVLIQAEERVGLALPRPDLFADVAFV
jgi:HK97 family phage major capsid protein